MKIYIIEKKKGRVYKSEDIVCSLTGLELIHDEKGAPVVPGFYISISDTRNYWALALCAEAPIGIDIEEISRPVRATVAKRLHKTEREYLSALDEESREWKEEFLSIWTRKEAYMKLKGEGLRMGLSSFCVIDDGQSKSFVRKNLVIGIAGDSCEYEIEDCDYDAPFEKSCLEAAADILALRMHGTEELKKKLHGKGYSDKDIEETVKKLKGYNYLNDGVYAKIKAENLSRGGKAPRLIEAELRKRGLSKEDAVAAASVYKEGQKEAAESIADKLCVSAKLPEGENRAGAVRRLKAKIARKLESLGYESNVIYDILDKLKL